MMLNILPNKLNTNYQPQNKPKNVSFGGKSIVSYPALIKDLLWNEKNPCPFCGRSMMNLQVFSKVRHDLTMRTARNFAEVLRGVKEFVRGDVRKEVCAEILEDAEYNNQEFLSQIVSSLQSRHLRGFRDSNIDSIRGAIVIAEDSIKDSIAKNTVIKYFEGAIDKLREKDARDFVRSPFITDALKVLRSVGVSETLIPKFVDQLKRMPKATTSVDAFFVRSGDMPFNPDMYAVPGSPLNAMNVFIDNLFYPALKTVDHIKPASTGGSSRTDNLWLTCGTDNNERGDMPLGEYAKKLGAGRVLMNTKIYLASLPRTTAYDDYREAVTKTLREESQGVLDKL